VFGAGGASKSACYVLKQKNIPFEVVSRKKTVNIITYNEVTETNIHHATLIINTTPLGMFPNVNEMPQIPYTALDSSHILIDLIYNPEETLFLKEGKKQGALTFNGLTMFKTQAEASWKLFNSVPPNTF
jgi:shikimate dehydrogenase